MLMADWAALVNSFEGWTLTEIKALSPRERQNWLEVAKYIRRKD
jgi:hypothetical protein